MLLYLIVQNFLISIFVEAFKLDNLFIIVMIMIIMIKIMMLIITITIMRIIITRTLWPVVACGYVATTQK